MGEFFVTSLVFFAAIALASVFFIGWVVYLVMKLGWLIVGGMFGTARGKTNAQLQPCPHLRCQQFNPVTARYCRRCGRPIALSDVKVPRSAAAA